MRYVCQICGYVYDDEEEKVPFASLPDDWRCPLCKAAKQDFKPEEIREKTPFQPAPAAEDADLKELSAGQLAALCSNLARGCEKQYKPKEAELFRELASYFTGITPPVNDASVESISALLQNDIERYAGVRATADAASDRGAARICVWGEKVTRMLSSLVNRYLNEGEAIYIGDAAPAQCPVCKVPEWKFEKIEGRARK